MKCYTKKELIKELKKEEKNLLQLFQYEKKNMFVRYICSRCNCRVTSAEYIYRKLQKYGKL